MPRLEPESQPVVQRFTRQVAHAIHALGATGHRLVAAASGGPDSTALLVALNSLRRQEKLDLAAAHVNHALRGAESDADEHFVTSLCEQLGVPLLCGRLAVPLDARDRAEGIEATARNLRQQFFADAARELNAKFIATAHTADDQAETVLHRIIRGTGLSGLAGIPASRELVPGVKLIRPLLRLRRADGVEYLAAMGQDSREDCSNLDLSFTRNRLRLELLPYLAEHFNPQVTEALTRLATFAADAQAIIDAQVDRLLQRAIITQDAKCATLRIPPLRRTPRFLLCQLIRRVWTKQSWPLQEIGQAEIDRVAELVTGIGTGASDLPGFIHARRTRDRLVLQRMEKGSKS